MHIIILKKRLSSWELGAWDLKEVTWEGPERRKWCNYISIQNILKNKNLKKGNKVESDGGRGPSLTSDLRTHKYCAHIYTPYSTFAHRKSHGTPQPCTCGRWHSGYITMETSRVAQMLLSPTQARTQRVGPTFFLSARLGKALCALEQQQRTGHTLGSSWVCVTLKSFPIQKQPLKSGGKKSPAKKLYAAPFPQLKYTRPLLLLTWLPCPFKETQTLSRWPSKVCKTGV